MNCSTPAYPFVAFDREVSDPRADTVIADNVRGLAQATKLLIDSGHTEIAYIGGRKGVETSIERLKGYQQAMRAAGLKPRAVRSATFASMVDTGQSLLCSHRPNGPPRWSSATTS